jgi:hypothetical protein
MDRRYIKGLTPKRLMGFSLLGISWLLLFWLNFAISPNFFAHFVAIPALFIASGVFALLLNIGNAPEVGG